ncbi:hypothetical protein LTR28_009603, partial [Elasticomyces elasticus]
MIHLEKVRERISKTFNQLDAFISRAAKSVSDTADTLYDIVETIDDLLKSRPTQPSCKALFALTVLQDME